MRMNLTRVARMAAVLAGGALAFGTPAHAETVRLAQAQAPAELLGLTVVAKDGVTSDQASVGRVDMGAVDSLSTPKVEKDFVLRNDRKAPITIGRLQPTCGCTSVLLG